MHAQLDADNSKLTISLFKNREKVGAWIVREGDAVGATGFRVSRIVRPDKEHHRIGWLELSSSSTEP